MKKTFLALLLALALCLPCFVSCDIGNSKKDPSAPTAEHTEKVTDKVTEKGTDKETGKSTITETETTIESVTGAITETEAPIADETEKAPIADETEKAPIADETEKAPMTETETRTEADEPTETKTETETRTTRPEDHVVCSFGKWKTVKDATCTEAGLQERVCECGEKETQTVGALGHTEVIDAAIEPTCMETGLTEGKHCSVCGDVLVEQEIVDLAHIWETGYEYDKKYHWYECYKCSAVKDKEAHTIMGDNGMCSVCNNQITATVGVVYKKSSDGTYAEVTDYTGSATNIVIADEYEGIPVTKIAGYAFSAKSITAIVIPDSVTSIGPSAFFRCRSLTSVTIGDNVTSIGSSAFSGCRSLGSIEIPDSVMSIGDDAFLGCTGLIEQENGVSYVDNWAVDFDNTVTFVELCADTVGIADKAFISDSSQLKGIMIPDSVTSIGNYAFYNCSSLTSIEIPDSVMSIGNYVFYNCSSLTSVTIPDSVTSIGNYAFWSCSSLASIEIPDSVTSIGSWAFTYCGSLTSVTFENTNGWWYSYSWTATSGTSISSSNLANTATAAEYLKSTYDNYYLFRD